MRATRYIGAMLLINALLLQGCVKRPLELRDKQDGSIEITLDWSGVAVPPQSVRYLLYNEDGVKVKEAICSTITYTDRLPAGRYRLLMHDTRAQRVSYRGLDRHATCEAYVADIRPPIICEPDLVYGANRCVEFAELVVLKGQVTKGTVLPKRLTKEVIFKFRVINSANTTAIDGVLDGLSSGILLASTKYNPTTNHMAFSAEHSEADKFNSSIHIFDIQAQSGTCVDVTLKGSGGTLYHGVVDLTDILHDIMSNNGGELPIEIPIEIEFEMKQIGGFTATVKPWDNSGSGGGDPRPN